jgi:hypothetical protein
MSRVPNILRLLNCITETIQVAEGRKYSTSLEDCKRPADRNLATLTLQNRNSNSDQQKNSVENERVRRFEVKEMPLNKNQIPHSNTTLQPLLHVSVPRTVIRYCFTNIFWGGGGG